MDENNIFDADDFQRKIIRDLEARNLFQRAKVDTLVDDDGAADAAVGSSVPRSANGRANGVGQPRHAGFVGRARRRLAKRRNDGDDVVRMFEVYWGIPFLGGRNYSKKFKLKIYRRGQ